MSAPTGVRRLRVLIDARGGDGTAGGVQQFVIGLAAGLSGLAPRAGEEFVFFGNDSTAEWLRPFMRGGCSLHVMEAPGKPVSVARAGARRLPGLAAVLSNAPGLWRTALPKIPSSNGRLEALGGDLVHFTHQQAMLTRIPSIYHPHDLQHVHLPEFFTQRERYLRERNYRAFAEQAALVAVASTWVKRDVESHYEIPSERVAVVPLAPATAAYEAPAPDVVSETSARLNLPPEFIFYPAQTWRHKNHSGLLHALAVLRDRHGMVVPAVFSGHRNNHFPELERLTVRLGLTSTTHFVGFVTPKDLGCIYARARVVVVPSFFEAASFPLWEAFQAGVAVACSNVTSLPQQAGDAALTFDVNDTEAMASAVRTLWADGRLRANLAHRGRERVARFTWHRTAVHFRAHYRRLVRAHLDEEDLAVLSESPLL